MPAFRTRMETTALLMGLASFAIACDNPAQPGGTPTPQQPTPQQPASVTSVQVSPDTFTLLATGGHRPLQAIARGRDGAVIQGRWVSWTSSDVSIATVDASGNVTGHQVGRAWITATVDGRTAQARVDVVPVRVDSLALSAPSIEMPWGTVRTLGATLYAADGRVLYDRPVTWTSSDSSVAEVDALGRIHARAGGRAWITATSEDGTARAEVIVPLVKMMHLRAADGTALPGFVQDTILDEGGGNLRRVRVQVMEGTLSLHSRLGTYEQRVVIRTHERRGTRSAWGSEIWEMAETVQEQTWMDSGVIEYNVYTLEPIFVSRATGGLTYYAQNAPADGFTVWQGVPGTYARLPYLYGL